MRLVAFLTYNKVSDFEPGWHENGGRRAFVATNVQNKQWAATQYPASMGDYAVSRLALWDEIEKIWKLSEPIIELADHVVVYVGSECGDYFIWKASQLPASKVTYVTCPCKSSRKDEAMSRAGHTDSRRVLSACGGHDAMRNMIANYLYLGTLSEDPARLTRVPPPRKGAENGNVHFI